jgi:hypothetical protein
MPAFFVKAYTARSQRVQNKFDLGVQIAKNADMKV